MSECGHDGWVDGCQFCEREHALALERMPTARSDVMAGRGLWLSADEARIVMRAIQRPRPVMVTEPGADVIARFMRRVEELEQFDMTALPPNEENR